MRLLKTDLYRAFFSKGFLLGSIGMLIMLLCGSVGMLNPQSTVAFQNAFTQNNMIDLLFLADTFIFSAVFATEWQSNYFRGTIIRCNATQYALSKSIATAISSGVSVALGAAVYIIGLCLYLPETLPSRELFSTVVIFNDMVVKGHPVLFFLSYLCVIFLQGMFFSVLGLTATGFFPNKYVAYATPFVASRFFNQYAGRHLLPAWMDPVKLSMGRLYDKSTAETLIIATVMFFLYTSICTFIFIKLIKRRVENE